VLSPAVLHITSTTSLGQSLPYRNGGSAARIRQPAGSQPHRDPPCRRAGTRSRRSDPRFRAAQRRRAPAGQYEGLVAETSSLLRASLPSRIELTIREVPDAGRRLRSARTAAAGDSQSCNNAAQAMDQIGCVEIETEVHQITEARSLTHGDLGAGRYVRIAVSDTGRGMDEVTLERIFEPFFTTRLAGNGLGSRPCARSWPNMAARWTSGAHRASAAVSRFGYPALPQPDQQRATIRPATRSGGARRC